MARKRKPKKMVRVSSEAVRDIVNMFGGSLMLSNMLNLPTSTVNSWVTRSGYIPDWHRNAILEIAKKQGKQLTADDFPKREK